MPNWCFTNYVIAGDEKQIADLYEKLSSLPGREDVAENGFGKFWLGNVLGLFGKDWNEIYCRGNIEALGRPKPTEIHFCTMTAWGDMPQVWDVVLENYPGLKYYYYAEEPGNCYYQTNDAEGKYFPARYAVDRWDSGIEYIATQEEVLAYVGKLLDTTFTSWKQMALHVGEYNTKSPETGIYINSITVEA